MNQTPSPPPDPAQWPNVTLIEEGERRTYVIGTAHVSEKSVREVEAVIEAVRPDTVCVELCQTRYDALTDERRWRKLDIFQIIRQRKVLFLLSNLALSAYQRRLGEMLGVRPGAELLAGVAAAEEIGAELVLADRDIQATLKRTWRNLGFLGKVKVLGVLSGAFLGGEEEITEAQLEKMKDQDTISEMMAEFARALPRVKGPLIDERDRFLMSNIEDAPGRTLVAVVGAGHVEGMLAHRGEVVDREALSEIPPPSRWLGLLKWVIPALILTAFYWGWSRHSGEQLGDMLFAWILPNSICAGLLTAIAGAKPLSVIAAFFVSPITSLNPTLGAGMVVGLLEAWLRKPTVEDCERVQEDVQSFRGLYRNPFLRVLWVAALSTLGSALGAWVGGAWVAGLVLGH